LIIRCKPRRAPTKTTKEKMMNVSVTDCGIGDEIRYFVDERREILAFLPTTFRTLLDVGCAAAAFGALVKSQLGAEVWGVEPVPAIAAIAKKKIDRVINSTFSVEADIPDRYFDVVTFNDCLEHFPDPFPPLELAKRKLKPQGTLVCSVPNVRYIENLWHLLVDMDWKYEDWGIRDKTHLRFFSRKSILRTLDEAGYDVVSIEGITPSEKYRKSRKLFILRQLFRKWMEDTPYQQFVVVSKPRQR
jgi:SAM-dependent methyltransferase